MSDSSVRTIIPARDRSTDAVIIFPEETVHDSAWLTIDLGPGRPSASLCIIRTDEGLVLDLYPLDDEGGECVATTFAFDDDLQESDDE